MPRPLFCVKPVYGMMALLDVCLFTRMPEVCARNWSAFLVREPWAILFCTVLSSHSSFFFFLFLISFCRPLSVSCGCWVSCPTLCILTWRAENCTCKKWVLLSAVHLFSPEPTLSWCYTFVYPPHFRLFLDKHCSFHFLLWILFLHIGCSLLQNLNVTGIVLMLLKNTSAISCSSISAIFSYARFSPILCSFVFEYLILLWYRKKKNPCCKPSESHQARANFSLKLVSFQMRTFSPKILCLCF